MEKPPFKRLTGPQNPFPTTMRSKYFNLIWCYARNFYFQMAVDSHLERFDRNIISFSDRHFTQTCGRVTHKIIYFSRPSFFFFGLPVSWVLLIVQAKDFMFRVSTKRLGFSRSTSHSVPSVPSLVRVLNAYLGELGFEVSYRLETHVTVVYNIWKFHFFTSFIYYYYFF